VTTVEDIIESAKKGALDHIKKVSSVLKIDDLLAVAERLGHHNTLEEIERLELIMQQKASDFYKITPEDKANLP
jgi:hypothetical protein